MALSHARQPIFTGNAGKNNLCQPPIYPFFNNYSQAKGEPATNTRQSHLKEKRWKFTSIWLPLECPIAAFFNCTMIESFRRPCVVCVWLSKHWHQAAAYYGFIAFSVYPTQHRETETVFTTCHQYHWFVLLLFRRLCTQYTFVLSFRKIFGRLLHIGF